ncbi:MAG TPA: hypothetical protein VFN67_31295 [Polyangiales bacterium]|nr:hypothetical protein [Polyangiales bacterium]
MHTLTQRTPTLVALLLCCAACVAAVLVAQNGYGDNLDNYRMLRSWQQMVSHGLYQPSRFQGNLPSELALGFSASQLGPLGTSLISALASLGSLVLGFRVLSRFTDPRRAAWALLPVAVNPYWILASCTAMDYIHPLPFYLFGVLMLLDQRTHLAVISLALAAGIRISFLPLGLFTLAWSFALERQRNQRLIIAEAALAFLVVTGLIYVPAWISSHLGLSFLSSDRPTAQGWLGMSIRWLYKSIYLYGLVGALVIAGVIGWHFSRPTQDRIKLSVSERRLVAAAVGVIAFHLLLFLYIPARVQYLMPAMLGFAALCAVWRVQRVALLGLALAQFSYWFVSIDLLQIDHATNDPCAGVRATNAQLAPHLGPGILAPMWNNHGSDETLPCFRAMLLHPPSRIHDKLPAGH